MQSAFVEHRRIRCHQKYGRYWIRTSDPFRVKEVRYHCANRQGKRVVRLHDGDTALYSAINEQICALSDAEIPVEVIPGISAYQAAAAGLASELTLPGVVQTIVLSRAGGRTGVPEREQLYRLAALRASLCIYLSARHVEEVQTCLLYTSPSPRDRG